MDDDHPDLAPSAREVASVAARVPEDRLGLGTPCEHYTVADLLDHLMGLAQAFTLAAEKVTPPGGSRPPEPSGARLDPRWRTVLPERLDRLAGAWRRPEAWNGTTEAGGVTMPAGIAGLVALDELVLHGWDLARATGQDFTCDPATTRTVHDFLRQGAEESGGRGQEGLFAAVVAVPPDAPLLDRALGYAGRDPAWAP
jgi:uncharacterized protein (TIGR03086 family)